MSQRLIIFTRYPEPGKTKTRLIPALGEKGAALLHRQLAEHLLNRVSSLHTEEFLSIEVCFTGSTEAPMREWLGNSLVYRNQGGGDLGLRIVRAFERAFREGWERVAIVGTDCPGIDGRLLVDAFEKLSDNDLVLGPAADGGYYLVGLKYLIPELFEGIDWGSDRVWERTVAIARSLNLQMASLPLLNDIDRPEDLPLLSAWKDINLQRL